MAQAIQAVIFDMDGVLLDSEWLYIQKYAEYLTLQGYPAKPEEMMFHAGGGPRRFYPQVKEKFGIPWDEDTYVQNAYAYIMAQEYDFASVRSPGVVPLLDYLAAGGYPVALATASSLEKAHQVLRACEIDHHFGVITNQENCARGKPAPDVYLEAARQLGVPPQHCLAVEDSANGLQAAVAAGMVCVGKDDARYGFDLSAADHHITQLLEIIPLIERLNAG